MEWLQTVAASVIGGLIAVVGAFILDRQRRAADREARQEQWVRDDELRLRQSRQEVYVRVFSATDELVEALMTAGNGPILGDFDYDVAQAIADPALAAAFDGLQPVAPRIQAVAPSDTRDAFFALYRLARQKFIDADVITPTLSAQAEFVALARRDLGHPAPTSTGHLS